MVITSWDTAVSESESKEILVDLALAHCRQAGTAGEALSGLISRRDFAAVCEYELDYSRDGYSPVQYLHLRQALGFFTKLEGLDIGKDKEQVARDKFYDSEISCLRTNSLFNMWGRGDFSFRRDVEHVLFRAQRKIAHVLGDVPALTELKLIFGPGATTSVPKRNACARTKLCAVPSCSANVLPLVPQLIEELPHYFDIHGVSRNVEGEGEKVRVPVEIHDGRLAFVPKNAKTYRSVMTEPTLNALLQGGYGRHIAKRLRGIGQDPRDQTRNQRLAREGSLTGALATLDLSSASDSISTELVAHLLPVDWYLALASCRTPTVRDGDVLLRLHKFSSMGNGFTFPLQTLIFWALASSASELSDDPETRVSVYGDDIIVGTASVPLLRQVLYDVGFTLNTEKSYWIGGFRESCGKDYYKGFDIRPCFIKSWLDGASLFVLHNFYVRTWQHEMAAKVRSYLHPELIIYGPDGYGDGHLISDDWNRTPHKRDRGWAGYTFDTYVHIGRKHTRALPGDRVLPCYSVYVREDQPYEEAWQQTSIAYSAREIFLKRGDIPARGLQTQHVRNQKGVWLHPALDLPGTRGYKRISIYTLTP